MMSKDIWSVQPAATYTYDEILQILDMAQNGWEYDYIIDRLYFYGKKGQRRTKNTDAYNVLTARQVTERQRRELSKNSSIDR